jgi:Tfp pilus assembly protein PilO
MKSIQLETRHQVILAAAGASVVVLLVARFVYLPAIGLLNDRRTTLKELRVKIADAQLLISQLPAEQAALAQAQERYRHVENWIGSGDSLARILEALSAQAKRHRLEVAVVQPPTEEQGSVLIPLGADQKLRQVPLKVTLKGRYWQIGDFLGELTSVPFLSSVQSFTMTRPDPTSARLQADLDLAVYLDQRVATP